MPDPNDPDNKDDTELMMKIEAIKYPNGPEDKLIEKFEFTWDTLKDFASHKDWPLASKLSACLLEMGTLAENLVEQMVFWRHVAECPNPKYIAEVERREDMSPTGKLMLMRQPDGDVVISVLAENREGLLERASVEFCTIVGGGKSSETFKALLTLMEAMEKDNEENPIA